MTPTDADRERAREIADGAAKPSRDTSYVIHEDHRRRLIDNIAAAIAAARAEGWQAGATAMRASISERFMSLPESYPTRHQWSELVSKHPLPEPVRGETGPENSRDEVSPSGRSPQRDCCTAARAEGFEAGLREPERRAREVLGDATKSVSWPALKEPTHGN